MTALPLLQLMQVTAPQRDTVVTVAARDGVDLIYALAAGSVVLVLLGLLTATLVAFLQIRKASRVFDEARRSVAADRGVESLRKVAENVADISGSLRNDMTKVSDSVQNLSDRLTQVSDRMEERIEEFNALMEIVQEEAEETFVDGASRARGFRAGIDSLRRKARSRARSRLGKPKPDGRTSSPEPAPRRAVPAEPAPERVYDGGRGPEDGDG